MKQKQRKRRLSLLAALLLLPVLAACGPGRAESCYGRVAEVQRAPDGSLSALVLDTGDEARTCVLLTPETHVASTVEDLLSEEEFLADPPMGTEVSVLFAEDPPPQTVTGEDGTQYSAQTADFLWVEDARYPEGLTLSDGTALEVWATGFQEKQYRLSDGTVLLQEFPPQTDFSNDYVGNTPLRDLSPALPDGLRRYYQDRGPLYDLTEELERADRAFCQDPENFQPFRVEQRVSWSASAPGAHYFLTTLSRTPEPRLLEEIQWTDAFDPMTGGAHPHRGVVLRRTGPGDRRAPGSDEGSGSSPGPGAPGRLPVLLPVLLARSPVRAVPRREPAQPGVLLGLEHRLRRPLRGPPALGCSGGGAS